MTQTDMFDDEPVRQIVRRLRERDIQAACVRHVRSQGVYARKFVSPSQRSVPDYIMLYRGHMWLVEFKRAGEFPTPAQRDEHDKIRAAGGEVWVIDDVEAFKAEFSRLQQRK